MFWGRRTGSQQSKLWVLIPASTGAVLPLSAVSIGLRSEISFVENLPVGVKEKEKTKERKTEKEGKKERMKERMIKF